MNTPPHVTAMDLHAYELSKQHDQTTPALVKAMRRRMADSTQSPYDVMCETEARYIWDAPTTDKALDRETARALGELDGT